MSKRVLVSVVVLVTVGLLAALYLFLVRPSAGRRPEVGAETLQRIDHDLSLGYFDSAVAALVEFSRTPQSESGYLRILKRLSAVAEARKDYEIVLGVARRAHEQIPGSLALRALYVHGALRCGGRALAELDATPPERVRGQEAARIALNAVLAEALLVGVPSNGGTAQGHPLLQLRGDSAAGDPAAGAPAAGDLERAAPAYQESRLYRDAALAHASGGEMERAADLAAAELVGGLHDEVAGLLLYDAGRWESSSERLRAVLDEDSSRLDIMMVLADARSFVGDSREAETLYRRVMSGQPALSWKPYAGVAALMAEQGDADGARAMLQKAHGLFPREPSVGIAYAGVLWGEGDREAAGTVLNGVVAASPENTSALLLQVQWGEFGQDPRGLEARLWNLHGKDQSNEAVTRELTRRLIEWGDLGSAMYAMELFEAAAGTWRPLWVDQYAGVVAAARGETQGAVDHFTACVAAKDSWVHRYNRAVVLLGLGMYGLAEADLLAADMFPREKRTNAQTAEIRALLAEARMRKGDLEGARRQAGYALDVDPTNLRALVIRRNLAGTTEK